MYVTVVLCAQMRMPWLASGQCGSRGFMYQFENRGLIVRVCGPVRACSGPSEDS